MTRTEAAAKAEFEEDNDHCRSEWDDASPELKESYIVGVVAALAAADAADRQAGVVRVDTRDEVTQGRVAKALSSWGIRGYDPEDYAALAHAVLAALAQEDNHG